MQWIEFCQTLLNGNKTVSRDKSYIINDAGKTLKN